MAGPLDNFDTLPAPAPDEDIAARAPSSDNPYAQFKLNPYADFAPAAAHENHYALRDVPGAAARNFGSSLYRQLQNMGEGFLHPIDTLSTMGRLGLSQLAQPGMMTLNAIKPHLSPEYQRKIDDFTSWLNAPGAAMGKDFSDAYGGWDKIKRTLAEDPARVLSDVLMFTPEGGVKTVGAAGKLAAKVPGVGAAGRMAASLPEAAAVSAIGQTSRTGEAVRDMALAGRRSVATGDKSALNNLRGKVPYADIVGDLGDAMETLRKQQQAEYVAGMDPVKRNSARVDTDNIDQALDSANAIGTRTYDLNGVPYTRNLETNANALGIRDKIKDIVEQWKTPNDLPPGVSQADYEAAVHTPWGLDELKQQVGNLRKALSPTENGYRPAYAYATSVYNGLKNEIKRVDPTYASTMEKYATSADYLDEAQKALLGSRKASADASLRKLQSVFRNDANTGYGNRVQLFRDLLDKSGRGDIAGKMAGQAMSSWWPRGIAGAVVNPLTLLGGGALAHLAAGPAGAAVGAALSPMLSPRLMGEAAFAYGRNAERFGAPTRRVLSIGSGYAPAAGRLRDEENDQAPYRRGGGVFRNRRAK